MVSIAFFLVGKAWILSVCVPFSVLPIPGYRSLIWIVLRLVLGSSSPSCDRHGLVKLFGAMNPREHVPKDIRERFLCS